MRRSSLAATALSVVVAFAFLTPSPSLAQATAGRASGAEPVAHKVAPDGKKVLTLADYGPWKRITASAISDNGGWMTYTFAPNDGDDTLFVKSLDREQLYTVPVGTAAAGRGARGAGPGAGPGAGAGAGGAPQFSDNSQWIGYFVNPPAAAKGRGRSARPASTPRAGNGDASSKGDSAAGHDTNTTRHLELLNLVTGDKYDVPNASGFKFASGSQWLAIKMNATPGDTAHHGTDLLLRRLATGATQNVGNVNQYDFNTAGNLLAYTVDAADKLGDGAYIINLTSGESRALDTRPMEYAGLAWRDSSSSLAVLRGDKPKGKEQRDNVMLAWSDAGTAAPAVEFDPSQDAAFPHGFVLSEYATPTWSKDGSRLFVGIKEQDDSIPKSTESQANLDIWHWKDVDVQSQQMIQINQLRHATFDGAFNLASKKFVQLADSNMKTTTSTADGRWAIGQDPTPYEYDYTNGQPHSDYYRINTATGERTLIAKNVLNTMGTSPDSKWFLYLSAGHVMAYDLVTGKTVNVDAATGQSFVNTDNDQAGEKPIWGVGGWSKDGKYVLLYDKYDLWALPLDGGKGRNLTGGAGAAQQVQFRIARFSADTRRGFGSRGGPAESVDLSKSQPLTAYGEWTKKSGYWQMPADGGKPTPLIWDDKMIGDAAKAKHADRVIFTEQTFTDFPDYWTSDAKFAAPRKLTDANPQIAEYAWGRRVLIDYTNSAGRKLQGTLTLPADYQPGKKYPMLVYIYEILSNTHHQFSMPVYDDRPHMSEYASDGYLMFEPDIVYETGRPGSSALDCVTAAVNKVIALGYADPAHIGLQGHSWGGYESSFILTQTSMFAAIVTGAPLTDLISMYGELYKQSGQPNGAILETSQGRMGVNVTPWNATALYESQSPVFNVTKITTPFMILQGTADGAVDWDQGLEFYNAARRNGKKVIWLSYPDEPHHLAKTPNQKDFQIRMKQFFDHYLKGAPAPDWMKNGLAQVHKGAPIH
ncbi:MAG: prolyl oligopeptidase family serine peptidase [Gemmatimonadaceae bacterium]